MQLPDKLYQNWQQTIEELAACWGIAHVMITQDGLGGESFLMGTAGIAEIWEKAPSSQIAPLSPSTTGGQHTAITQMPEAVQALSEAFVSFFALPLSLPKQKLFGHLCLIDEKENDFLAVHSFLGIIRNSMEMQLGMHHELSAGKRAEELLEKKRSYLQTIFDAAPISMMLIDDKTNTVTINDTVKKLFQLKNNDPIDRQPGDGLGCAIALGNPYGCGYSLECRNCQIRSTIKKVFATKQSVHHVEADACFILGGKVKRLWVELSGEPLQIDGQDYVVISLNNITERKNAELKLIDSERRLKEAEQIAKVGNWELDLSKNKLVWSDQVFRNFGFEPQSFNPDYEHFLAFVHPKDREKLQEAYEQSVKERTPYEVEHRHLMPDGSVRHFQERGTTEYDKLGRPTRSIGTVLDITLQKSVEAELRGANAAKDKFFSIIAHDLKSPFNNLVGLFDLLNMPGTDDISKKEIMAHMSSVVMHGRSLLENLLEWARSQTGRVAYSPEDLDTRLMVTECISFHKETAKSKDITLHAALPLGHFTVFADRQMLSTVLRNLVSNAIKFTPRGGQITIGHQAFEKGREMFYVKDTGVGIPPDSVGKIFQIDQNYSTQGTEREKGTGLGLLLCKEFIEKNDGEIWVESKLNEGSTFFFTLLHEEKRTADLLPSNKAKPTADMAV